MKLPIHLPAIACAAGILLTGCVGYVPSFSKQPVSGKRVPREDADFIVPGKTTRAEVIRKLGAGYRESERYSALGYGWEMPAGFAFWIIASTHQGIAGTNEFTAWRALFVAFDSRAVVTRKEFVRLNQKITLDEQLEAWARRNGNAGTTGGN